MQRSNPLFLSINNYSTLGRKAKTHHLTSLNITPQSNWYTCHSCFYLSFYLPNTESKCQKWYSKQRQRSSIYLLEHKKHGQETRHRADPSQIFFFFKKKTRTHIKKYQKQTHPHSHIPRVNFLLLHLEYILRILQVWFYLRFQN